LLFSGRETDVFVFIIRTVLRDAEEEEEEDCEELRVGCSSSCHMKPEVYPLSQGQSLSFKQVGAQRR